MRGCFAGVQALGVLVLIGSFVIFRPDVALIFGGGFFLVCLVVGGIGVRWAGASDAKAAAEAAERKRERSSLRACPSCAEKIQRAAKKCRFCGEVLA